MQFNTTGLQEGGRRRCDRHSRGGCRFELTFANATIRQGQGDVRKRSTESHGAGRQRETQDLIPKVIRFIIRIIIYITRNSLPFTWYV